MATDDDDGQQSFLDMLKACAQSYDAAAMVAAETWEYTQAARLRGKAEMAAEAIEMLHENGMTVAGGLAKDDRVMLADSIAQREGMQGVAGIILSVTPRAMDIVHVLFDTESKGRILPALYVHKVAAGE